MSLLNFLEDLQQQHLLHIFEFDQEIFQLIYHLKRWFKV